jgi:hypothetical protein
MSHYIDQHGFHFWLGPTPAAIHRTWSVFCARAPLRGAVAWRSGAWHFAAGVEDDWWSDWRDAGAVFVGCVTHADVRDELTKRLAIDGRTLDEALATTPGGLAELCRQYDLPWSDP